MITMTCSNGDSIDIVPTKIVALADVEGGTAIYLEGSLVIGVLQSREAIKEALKEFHKLSTERAAKLVRDIQKDDWKKDHDDLFDADDLD